MQTDTTSIVRVDAKAKADGSLQYSDDLPFDGLYAFIIRSQKAHAKILSIVYDENFDFSEFTIVSYEDIEGKNINPIIYDDQPFLAQEYVKFIGEPILLLAHKDKTLLQKAQKHIFITYKELPQTLTFQEDKIFKRIHKTKGEKPKKELLTLSKTYTTPYQEHIYLEPQTMVAFYNQGEIKIVGSMQCPFYVEESLEALSGKKIEIEQAPTGGAFGGKEDYPSLMAAYVYLLSKKAKQDVKLTLSRTEDIAFSTKRHPSQITLTSQFDKKGKLYSLQAKILLDGGAYATLSSVVLTRLVLHIAGFYDIDYIDVDAYAYATNTPPNGAFRGFGAPQAFFALERHIDDIAKKLHLNPADIRKINLPTPQTKLLTDVEVKEYKEYNNLFTQAMQQSDFYAKYLNKEPNKGIGMSLFFHGGGFVGLGEEFLNSKVSLYLKENAQVEIKVSSTEMGQGAMTTLPQMVAKELKIDPSYVIYTTPNTKKVPNSGPTVSSRTIMIVGTLLQKATKKLKNTLGVYNSTQEYEQQVSIYLQTNKTREFQAQYQKPKDFYWDEERFSGYGYSGYSLGCYIAEVAIDPITFQVYVENFYAFHDVGEVINLTLAQGQVEGAIAQGLGYALLEDLVYENAKVKNPHISHYVAPLASDMPKNIKIEFLNTQASPKGLGELPIDGVAPAIINAVANALDIEPNTIPLTPENLEKLCR